MYTIRPLVILQGRWSRRFSEPLGQFSKAELLSSQDDCDTCLPLSSVCLTWLVSYMDLPDRCSEAQGTCKALEASLESLAQG